MNKKELVEKIESLPSLTSITSIRPYIDKKVVLGLICQLDEPEKVVIPQFVADWYEENKDVFDANLYRCAYNIPSVFDGAKINEFERWFLTNGTKPFQTLVNMHQFGYEVEKEKQYWVKLKAVDQYLISAKSENFLGFLQSKLRTKFTRKELEDLGFGWVLDCPGIELVEVEE
jgi:gp178